MTDDEDRQELQKEVDAEVQEMILKQNIERYIDRLAGWD